MFCPRRPSACRTVPQILEHSTVSHGGGSNILLGMIFQAQDGLKAQKHGLSDLMPQEPDVSEEGRLAALAAAWIWIRGTGY